VVGCPDVVKTAKVSKTNMSVWKTDPTKQAQLQDAGVAIPTDCGLITAFAWNPNALETPDCGAKQ